MLFNSTQSKVLLFFAVPVVILTQMQHYDIVKLFTQLLLFAALIYNTDCLVVGNCNIWAWLSLVFPVIVIIGYLFYRQPLTLLPPIHFPTTSLNNSEEPV